MPVVGRGEEWEGVVITTNSRGEVAPRRSKVKEKTSDRYSVCSLCCDDLNCRRLPTSQYQIVIGVINVWPKQTKSRCSLIPVGTWAFPLLRPSARYSA